MVFENWQSVAGMRCNLASPEEIDRYLRSGCDCLGGHRNHCLGLRKAIQQTYVVVCYFKESVGGMNIGAQVVFKGVKVGFGEGRHIAL